MKVIGKENIKNGLDCAMGIAKKSMRILGPIAVAVWYNKSTVQDVMNEIRYNGNVKYDDAVKVITDSGMYSGDKCDAISLLKTGESSEYYKAIVNVVRSNMYSSDKLEMIQTMNCKIDEGSQV